MNKTSVFAVTGLGKALLDKPQGRITGDARLLMGLIDGNASAAEIAEKVPPSVRVHLSDMFKRLLNYGVIEETSNGETAAVPRDQAQAAKITAQQAETGGENESSAGDAGIERKRRSELEQELLEVHAKLEATITRQKKVEQDYLRLTQQVAAYTHDQQAKPSGQTSELAAQSNASDGLRSSLDSINQLSQALLEQQEILGNTLRLHAYQAQLDPRRHHNGHGKDATPDNETLHARFPLSNFPPIPSPQSSPTSGRGSEREKQLLIPAGERANGSLREFHVKEYAVDDAREAQSHPHYKSLRGLDFFKGFSNTELLNFLKVAKWQEVETGDTILSEGEVGMSFYVIVSGSVSIFRKNNMLISLERGDFFGEFAYLSGEDPVRSARAVATSACELLAVDPLDIEFSPVQLRLRVVEALLRGQVRRALLSDQRIDRLSAHP